VTTGKSDEGVGVQGYEGYRVVSSVSESEVAERCSRGEPLTDLHARERAYLQTDQPGSNPADLLARHDPWPPYSAENEDADRDHKRPERKPSHSGSEASSGADRGPATTTGRVATTAFAEHEEGS
jgi:hypothetical protein